MRKVELIKNMQINSQIYFLVQIPQSNDSPKKQYLMHVCDLVDMCRHQANLRTTNTECCMMDGPSVKPFGKDGDVTTKLLAVNLDGIVNSQALCPKPRPIL